MMNDLAEESLFVLWDRLNHDEMQERINWLRENLAAGTDWGFCGERRTLVLTNKSSKFLYKMRWFEPGQQTLATDIKIGMDDE